MFIDAFITLFWIHDSVFFRFKEFELKLPDEVVEGTLRMKDAVDDPVNLQIAIHHGQYEELFAMATIDFSDIKELVSVGDLLQWWWYFDNTHFMATLYLAYSAPNL